MSKFELRLPKMGESVAEATITNWLKQVGDTVEMDESVVEIATDKVDSDVPSEVAGILIEKKFNEGDLVQVGQVLAIIETNVDIADADLVVDSAAIEFTPIDIENATNTVAEEVQAVISKVSVSQDAKIHNTDQKFYTPLVRKIAETEGVSQQELDNLAGSGLDGRVTKDDLLLYIKNKTNQPKRGEVTQHVVANKSTNVSANLSPTTVPLVPNEGEELITLTRMGKLISDHMLHSTQKAAHVQSFIEVDVTNIVKWRAKVKDVFLKREGENLTYTPIFMMAVAQALKKYPLVNIAFDGVDKVVIKKQINLGMASALPDGNLIVPVIKNAENLNLIGMTKAVNDLAVRSKNNALKPEDIKGSTYTVTNIGGFGSIFGTPIINQPESAILAIGAIRKVPAVIETPEGDFVGIRQKMYLSHSYDHRVINGALGGMFIKEIKDILEAWDVNMSI